MRRRVLSLFIPLLVMLIASTASAAESPIVLPPILRPPLDPPVLIDPILNPLKSEPVPIAFSAVANRYSNVDPATVFDLNGDLAGDIQVDKTKVTGKNGAKILVLDPPVLNLDQAQIVPDRGYGDSAPLQFSRVYAAKLNKGYAKFMVLQASPKVTLWFHYGEPTSSILSVDGSEGRASLTWQPLPDAELGYNIYRYEVNENSYTVTSLTDFAVKETAYVDATAKNRYYLYVVQAVKAGGTPGSLTTVAPVFVQWRQRILKISLSSRTATLDDAPVTLPRAPEIRNGLLMVPSAVLEAAGVQVSQDGGAGQVTLRRRVNSLTYTVVMTLDSPDYTWNGATQEVSVPPYRAGGVVMLPVRVVAPLLGLGVTFDSTTRTATLGWHE